MRRLEPLGAFARPRVVLSECLELAAVRYNAQSIRAPIVHRLAPHVDLVPVCPEVEIGLGVPRDPIRLVRLDDGVHLHQPSTGRDLTGAMDRFAHTFLDGLHDVDGFLLKSRSPSCGIKDVKLYGGTGDGAAPVGKDAGRFAAAVQERFPDRPVEDEGRLTNRAIRQHWLTWLFGHATLRQVIAAGEVAELIRFHSAYKLVLMAHDQAAMRELGRLLAEQEGRRFGDVAEEYRAGFARAMARTAGVREHLNVLEHARGYFKKGLAAREKRHFETLLDDYRNDRVGLGAVLPVLRSWTERFDEGYLRGQRYFEPYPRELVDARDSGR